MKTLPAYLQCLSGISMLVHGNGLQAMLEGALTALTAYPDLGQEALIAEGIRIYEYAVKTTGTNLPKEWEDRARRFHAQVLDLADTLEAKTEADREAYEKSLESGE